MKASKKLFLIRFKSLISYIIYNLILLVVSSFLDKFVQMLFFVLFFNIIQGCFKYRFHADTIENNPIKTMKLCKFITIFVELIYLMICTNFVLSLYSNLLVITIIALLNCFLEFLFRISNINSNDFKNKENLLFLCKKANLSELATKRMLMKYVENKTYQEIANLEYVEVDTIKKSINRSRNKILKG